MILNLNGRSPPARRAYREHAPVGAGGLSSGKVYLNGRSQLAPHGACITVCPWGIKKYNKEIVSENLGVDSAMITESSSFKDDLGADSLDLLEMVMAIEDEYEIESPTEDLEQIATVGDVMNYINERKE